MEWAVVAVILSAAGWAIMVAGVRIAPVLTDSMTPNINPGDAVLYVSSEFREPQEGDIIVFNVDLVGDRSNMLPMVHRWIGTRPDGRLITQGDNNERVDPWPTIHDDIVGTHIGTLPTHVLRHPFTIPVAAAVIIFALVYWWIAPKRRTDADSDENPPPNPQ